MTTLRRIFDDASLRESLFVFVLTRSLILFVILLTSSIVFDPPMNTSSVRSMSRTSRCATPGLEEH